MLAPPKKAVYEDATALIVHAAMRRSLFHMTSELEDGTDKSLHGVMLRFASHTTRIARKVLQHSAADETGTRRRLDCDRLLWQTSDQSGWPCRTKTATPDTKHTQILFRGRSSCGDDVKM
jgi:hypothetical protein